MAIKHVNPSTEPAGFGLSLSGAPHVVWPDGRTTALGEANAAMLAWLALEGATPRARMAELLWPESTPEAARATLRQRLFTLKKSLNFELVCGQETLSLAAGVVHDLAGSGTILEKSGIAIGGEFDQWLARQQAQRGLGIREALVTHMEQAEATGDLNTALRHARELLALEPLSENAHRNVMRLHYLAGDRAAALLAFDACEQVLKNEVGMRPSADTLGLLRAIELAQSVGLAAPRTMPVSLRRPPQLFGREPVLMQLQQAWQNQQHFVLLGDPGLGKTRVLEQFAESWPGAQLVRARPGDEAVPLALVTRLVEQLCSTYPVLGTSPSGLELLQRLQFQFTTDLALQRQPPCSMAPTLQPWLVEAGKLGVSLMLDDWQFADETSVALLMPCLTESGLAPLRIGLASRVRGGPLVEQRLQTLRQVSALCCVSLQPLDDGAIAALLDTLLADLCAQGQAADVADCSSLVQAMQKRVGGNPLHLLESLRHMAHNRLPLQSQHLNVPRQVRDLVAERLAQLPDDARHLLQVAAVAGQDFCVELAETVMGRHALALAEAWSELEQCGMFGLKGASHDLFSEVALTQLPDAIARVLHERVARWLVPRPHEPGRLAAHWRAAGQDAEAVPHLLVAAMLAWHAARAEEAFDFFAQAAQVTLAQGKLDLAFAHWFDNAEAMSEIGTAAQTAECLQQLEQLAHTDMQALRVQFVRAVLRAAQGEVDAGLSAVSAMLADAIALGDTRVEAECRFASANRATADGDFDEALQHLAVGERLQNDLGNVRLAAAMAATKAMVLGLRGQPRLAHGEAERILPLLVQHNDRATWTVLCSARALQWMRQGELAAALAEAQRVREASSGASIAPMDLLVILRNLVDTLRWAGQFEEALEVGQEFERRLAPQGHFSSLQRTLAGLYLSLGRADLAMQILPVAEAVASTPLRQRERLQLGLLRVQLGLTTGQGSLLEWPLEALTTNDLALASEWVLWSGLTEVSPWPKAELTDLVRRVSQAGLQLFAEPLQALLAALGYGPWSGDQSSCELSPVLLPWSAFFHARCHAQRGQLQVAGELAMQGVFGLRQLADRNVPEPFRESFLRRHPAHSALQALSSRLATNHHLQTVP
ncbi:MAG: hypothetical protein KA740_08240 [Rhodoferax sp.]|nr:hypothetical protein [Rhodoferax sp.]